MMAQRVRDKPPAGPVPSRLRIRRCAMLSPCRLHVCGVRWACGPGRHDCPGGGEDNTARPGSGGETVTYSIVARDPQTGLLGVAVQTAMFAAGASVP
jgi:hypothetical protein